MFAIPGILGLLFFLILRPQEAVERLQALPFLYMFFAFACFGVAVDKLMRVHRPVPLPQLPLAGVFAFWALVTVTISAPDRLVSVATDFFITLLVFVLIAQGVQTLRVFRTIAVWLAVLGLCLAAIGVDQGRSEPECMVIPPRDDAGGDILGVPDGRPCERNFDCYRGDPDPDADYLCEKPGWFKTHSIGLRVRYRGVLQDPNELALSIGMMMAFAVGWAFAARTRFTFVFATASVVLSGWCISFTESRSGQLVWLTVLAVFVLWRFGKKAGIAMALVAQPVLMIVASGGDARLDADASTLERYEAWRTGLDLFRESPIWGVGLGQFGQHHYLTAHNSFIQVAAETGFFGLYLFTLLFYVCIKLAWEAIVRYRARAEARVAEIWAVSLLAAFAAMIAGGAFLSFAYKHMLWIYVGMSGAYYACVKSHDSDFRVQISGAALLGLVVLDIAILVGLSLFLRLKGF